MLIIVDKKAITITCFTTSIHVFFGMFLISFALPNLQDTMHSFLDSKSLQILLKLLIEMYALMISSLALVCLLNYLLFWKIFSCFSWYTMPLFILFVLEGTALCSFSAVLIALLPKKIAQLTFAISYLVIFRIHEIFKIITNTIIVPHSLRKIYSLILPDVTLFDMSSYIIHELPPSHEVILLSILYLLLYNALYFELALYLWYQKSLHTNKNSLV